MQSSCIPSLYQLPDVLWEHMKTLLPPPKPKKKAGRPRMDDRQAMTAIFYLLRTGCQWKALPRCLGAASTVHDRFQEWEKAGVFKKIWEEGLIEYDQIKGLDWEWQTIDGTMTKAPLGGEATGHNPTDRRKRGTKRSMHTEGNGIPIGVAVDGANRHDKKMMVPTLEADVIEPPKPTEDNPQNMVLDKGYDYQDIRDILIARGYIPHVLARGEESKQKREIPNYRARRWVVERTHSWLNRFRRLLIRWEKKVENYLAMIDFACAWIVFHAAGLFG